MAAEEGEGFEPQTCNLADFCRRTGLMRSRPGPSRPTASGCSRTATAAGRPGPPCPPAHGLVGDLLEGAANSQVT